MVICMATEFLDTNVFVPDVRQTDKQSGTFFKRDVFILPPAEHGILKEYVLRVRQPLYGQLEIGFLWLKHTISAITERLKIVLKIHDP